MRKKIPAFSSGTVETVARAVGETYTGSQITSLLIDSKCAQFDSGPPHTKWARIAEAIERKQKAQGDGNPLLYVVKKSIEPGRLFSSKNADAAEGLRAELATVLSTEGYALDEDGTIRRAKQKASYEDARNRARGLREHLRKRGSHEEVLKHCRDSLLQTEDDYYEVVFEAAKGLEDRVRKMSHSELDGRKLAQNVLGAKNRTIPFNTGETKTERNEQESMRLLVEGVIAGFRNPPAHRTRLDWKVSEQDAQDVLGLLALIHRRLDAAEEILRNGGGDAIN